MRTFQKVMVSAMSVFAAASFTSPVWASTAPLSGTTDAYYTVKSGDSLWKIAEDYDISLQSLIAANENVPIFNMQIGSNLIIPLGESSVQDSKSSHATKTVSHHASNRVNNHAPYSEHGVTRSTYNDTHQSGVRTTAAASTAYSQNLYWLSHVINAEANAEPFKAQLGVGDVVMHRLESSSGYKSVHDVVFAIENGHYQFTCVANGYIYSNPTGSAVAAAREVLNQHVDVVPGANVFFNPAKTPASSWVWNQPEITRIGDFIFSK